MLYPPVLLQEAAPKCISERTSYHEVCLAFHPYPQLIRRVFNLHRFGPPRALTPASTWPWIDHLVSGLLHATVRRLRLAFAAPTHLCLSLPRRVTRRLIMQKARGRTAPLRRSAIVLPLLVDSRFQVLFHSPRWGTFHLSLTVLVHYRSPVST